MYDTIKQIADTEHMAFGVAATADLREHYDALPMDQTEGLNYGISIGMAVSGAVLKGCVMGPTRHYLHNYRMTNWNLDMTAARIAAVIQDEGYRAMPIPASQLVDWEAQTAHLSHKMIALRAGLGWIGRNNLLVHPKWGSKIRIATILSDMPLKTDSPIEKDCGHCRQCIEICPVNAIKDSHKEWNKQACLTKLQYYAKSYGVGQNICGLCLKVCDPKE